MTNISNQDIEFMVRPLWPSDTAVSLWSPAFLNVEETPLSVMMMLFSSVFFVSLWFNCFS